MAATVIPVLILALLVAQNFPRQANTRDGNSKQNIEVPLRYLVAAGSGVTLGAFGEVMALIGSSGLAEAYKAIVVLVTMTK